MRISDWSSDVCSSDLLMFALVPVTPTWGVSDFNVGVLLFLAIAGLEVYAEMLGGWSSNSKYELLGGLRVTAQTVSYEVFMGRSEERREGKVCVREYKSRGCQ